MLDQPKNNHHVHHHPVQYPIRAQPLIQVRLYTNSRVLPRRETSLHRHNASDRNQHSRSNQQKSLSRKKSLNLGFDGTDLKCPIFFALLCVLAPLSQLCVCSLSWQSCEAPPEPHSALGACDSRLPEPMTIRLLVFTSQPT
jgi:hypothetical protein